MISQTNIPQFLKRYATSGSAAVSWWVGEKFRERATGRLFRTIVPVLHFTFYSVCTVEVRINSDLFAVSAFLALPSGFIAKHFRSLKFDRLGNARHFRYFRCSQFRRSASQRASNMAIVP